MAESGTSIRKGGPTRVMDGSDLMREGGWSDMRPRTWCNLHLMGLVVAITDKSEGDVWIG